MTSPLGAIRGPHIHGQQYVQDGAHFDVIVVGSGFGGSVSALRLAEKGYSVLVIEQGRRLKAEDFPETNWDLRKWLWMPKLGMRGLFRVALFRHVTVFAGAGVGGGSLVYANTLPVPPDEFFQNGSWKGLADWKQELAPHYATAKRMLGAARNPKKTTGDDILHEVARDMGRADHFDLNEVAVHFGSPKKTVPDPYFNGEGPERTGCHFCGACMTGCRHGAKNTLDKNYLWLAEVRGAVVQPDTKVNAVRPRTGGGYEVLAELSSETGKTRLRFSATKVVLSGGVLGTVSLLSKMHLDKKGLPNLSPRVGEKVRTNSEALIGVITPRTDVDLSEGIAITSIFHTDAHSHVEPVRYGSGSGAFRMLVSPHVAQGGLGSRLMSGLKRFAKDPLTWAKVTAVDDWAKHTQILLYMRTLDGSLALRRLPGGALGTTVTEGEAPTASIPEATEIADRFAQKLGGVPASILSETLFGIPSTAHILGGAVIGKTEDDGVIDVNHEVHNYPGLYVVDGAAVSANPGVNPSLTITAMAERAMSRIPAKS
jgi:cholesterol oxidase